MDFGEICLLVVVIYTMPVIHFIIGMIIGGIYLIVKLIKVREKNKKKIVLYEELVYEVQENEKNNQNLKGKKGYKFSAFLLVYALIAFILQKIIGARMNIDSNHMISLNDANILYNLLKRSVCISLEDIPVILIFGHLGQAIDKKKKREMDNNKLFIEDEVR